MTKSIGDFVAQDNRLLDDMVRAVAEAASAGAARVRRPAPTRAELTPRPAAARPCRPPRRAQGSNFDKTGSLLGGTMKRLDALAQTKHGRHMIYLGLFVLCVFVLLYFTARRR